MENGNNFPNDNVFNVGTVATAAFGADATFAQLEVECVCV